jgi:hypothetical protein
MEIYWRINPARQARVAIQATFAGANFIHRYLWKYQAWLQGYNGGPMRLPVMKLNDSQMRTVREPLLKSGFELRDESRRFLPRTQSRLSQRDDLLLTHEDVRSVVDMADAIAAMEARFVEEGEGRALAPPRINMKAGAGWLRVGPVALDRSGWMGFKAMNLAPGRGVRYQVHLYRIETGELLAIMDAQHLTTLRTGATSAVATRRLAPARKMQMALLGSGAEARAQLEAMTVAGFVASVRIFSPTPANRQAARGGVPRPARARCA